LLEVRCRDVVGEDPLQTFDGAVDVVVVVVAPETDAHEAGRGAQVAAAGVLDPAFDLVTVETEEVVDVGLGAEAPAADADAVLVTEDGGDQAGVPPVDGEGDHAEPSR
jgi:hypothetical protein